MTDWNIHVNFVHKLLGKSTYSEVERTVSDHHPWYDVADYDLLQCKLDALMYAINVFDS